MNNSSLLGTLRGGLIVSCQALENEPLHGSHNMALMAVAAKEGGAVGIRANTGKDIRAIKDVTGLPVIGIVKRYYGECEVFITPTLKEVEEVVAAGAEIVAIDATKRVRPDGSSTEDFIKSIKERFPQSLIMADVSTIEEGILAERFGADIVASTLSGYTPYSPKFEHPNFDLLENLVKQVQIPVIAEGNIRTPEEAALCQEKGVWAVVVGSAITRPQEITRWYVEKLGRNFKHV